MEYIHYLVETKYVLQKKHHKYCELSAAFFVSLSVCIVYLKFCCIFPESFSCMQIKLELFSPEIVPALENKELLGQFRVYRKSATNAQTDGRITTDGQLCTGTFISNP